MPGMLHPGQGVTWAEERQAEEDQIGQELPGQNKDMAFILEAVRSHWEV